MKRLIIPLIALAFIAAACKTTEANYRAAYQVAKAAQEKKAASAADDDGLDDNTRRMLARQKKSGTSTHIIGSDTLKITTLFVAMVEGPYDRVPQYSVVLNAFSQIFNAKSMMKRLQDNGFADAYVFQTATPDYYVAAGGTNSIDSVPALLHGISNPASLGARAGFPAIIRSGGYRPQ